MRYTLTDADGKIEHFARLDLAERAAREHAAENPHRDYAVDDGTRIRFYIVGLQEVPC